MKKSATATRNRNLRIRPSSAASSLYRRSTYSKTNQAGSNFNTTSFYRKKKAPKFFENTRVDSCKSIVMKNGKPMALPFNASKRCLNFSNNKTPIHLPENKFSIYR